MISEKLGFLDSTSATALLRGAGELRRVTNGLINSLV
jgi:hypothetical protein